MLHRCLTKALSSPQLSGLLPQPFFKTSPCVRIASREGGICGVRRWTHSTIVFIPFFVLLQIRVHFNRRSHPIFARYGYDGQALGEDRSGSTCRALEHPPALRRGRLIIDFIRRSLVSSGPFRSSRPASKRVAPEIPRSPLFN